MPQSENSAAPVRPEGDSTPGHFLQGFYFVPMPDFSDETVWTVNKGRSMPALIAVLRALHDQHRRGRTEEIRADAADGRLTIGLKALSRANGMQTTALLRQLRFLQRAGLLNVHDGERLIERDPATGKILKGRGRTPPKVIIMTLNRSMMRGGRRAAETGRNPSQKPEETGRIPSLKPHALRDGKRTPSRETTSTEVVSYGNKESREHPAHEGRSVPPLQAQRGGASEPPIAAQVTRQERQRFLAARYAKGLGITIEEVALLWSGDKEAFRQRLTDAGIDWRTGKSLYTPADASPVRKVQSARSLCQPSTASTFAVRRQTTDSLTVSPSVAGEAAQALDGPPVSDEERKAAVLRDLDLQAHAGLTAGRQGPPDGGRGQAA